MGRFRFPGASAFNYDGTEGDPLGLAFLRRVEMGPFVPAWAMAPARLFCVASTSLPCRGKGQIRGRNDDAEKFINYECASSIWVTSHRQQPLQCITDGGARQAQLRNASGAGNEARSLELLIPTMGVKPMGSAGFWEGKPGMQQAAGKPTSKTKQIDIVHISIRSNAMQTD